MSLEDLKVKRKQMQADMADSESEAIEGIGELRKKRQLIRENSEAVLENMQIIADESTRVAEVAHASRRILQEIDDEFERQTGLQGNDIVFLFTAIGLQMARIVIQNELSKIENAGTGNSREAELHKFQEKILGKFSVQEGIQEKPYYASMEHIITKPGVPYDATATLTQESISKLINKGRTWDFNLDSMIPTEKLGIFKGANHRFSTLGHDPILGLIFGTGNIMTNTITCVKTPVVVQEMKVPVLTTNHVVFTSDYKDPRIATYGSTLVMLKNVIERTIEQPSAFVASLIKQIIHIGTDLYTPCGIQIPAANLVLSNSKVEEITREFGMGDIVKIGKSATIASLINIIIGTLHGLAYDEKKYDSRDVYEVKTRKILMWSNTIATSSNLIWVGANVAAGDKSQIRNLDIGGLLVTLHRLRHDSEFIRRVKEEFIFGKFNQLIQGEPLQLKEIKSYDSEAF